MELQDFLQEVSEDAREVPEARKLALQLYESLSHGLIPDPRRVDTLRRMLRKPGVCASLKPDGQCDWLRKNARKVDLLPPLPGQNAYCNRRASGNTRETFNACPGYRKGDYKGEDR